MRAIWLLSGLLLLSGSGAALVVWERMGGERTAVEGGAVTDLAVHDAKVLIQTRCGVCHLPPDEHDLPASAWERFMGRKGQIIARAAEDRGIETALLPSNEEIQSLRTYLVSSALSQEQLIGPAAQNVELSGRFEVIAKGSLKMSAAGA